jgi:putative transposase
MDDVRGWAARPLEDVYPVIFLDALVLKIREGGSVQRRACYLALGITVEGDRDVLGLWFQESEGAKFWMQVLVRHEALRNWMEVEDHHRLAVAAAGLKLRAA